VATIPYAELHAHTNFSFLDGASPADELVERAVELGLTGLAVTDRNGLYGAVRFMGAAEEAGLHGVVGTELDLLDPAVPDPDDVVLPARRRRRRRGDPAPSQQLVLEGQHALGEPVEALTGLCRLDPAARAVEQFRPEPLLERANLEADRRLGDPEALRSVGEALALYYLAEGGELSRVHKQLL
jgi:hypothetical protein